MSKLTDQSKEADFLAVTEDLSKVTIAYTVNDPATALTDAEIDVLSSALVTVVSKLPDGRSYMDSLTDVGSTVVKKRSKLHRAIKV